MKKLIFYLLFIALGTASAEVLSYSYPPALLNPLGFLPYGVLFVFFINYLIKKQVSDWKTIYLFGALIGLISEGLFIKVLFFGWGPESFIFNGLAIFEFFVLVFFFHPLFSFIIPVFIAKNFFNFPFAVKESKRKILFLSLLPLYPIINSTSLNGDFSLVLVYLPLSFLIISIILILYYFNSNIKDITLKRGSIILTTLLTIFIYFLGFFTFKGHNKEIFPSLFPLIFIILFMFFILFLIKKRTINLKTVRVHCYPKINLAKTLLFLVLYSIIILTLTYFALILSEIISVIMTFFLFGGAFLGTTYFIYVLINTFRKQS